MAQMIDLRDLLKHEILDLYSAEEQIIEALPKMIEKAGNAELKKALRDHLKVTEQQKERLDEVKGLLGEGTEGSDEKKGFFSNLFGGSDGVKCKGTEGLITEGEKTMGEDMSPEVLDAAIIASAQKIEHYEISGYGTAAAYARELGLSNVAGLLQQTLDEEYFADDSLTKLAVGKLNIDAENADGMEGSSGSKSAGRKSGSSKGSSSKGSSSKGASKSSGPSKAAASKGGSSKSNSSKSGSASKGSGSKSSGPSKSAASKGGSSKGSSSKGSSSKGSSSKGSKSSGNKVAVKSVSKSSGKSGGGNSKSANKSSGKSKASGGRKR